jgi:hypothetical protein
MSVSLYGSGQTVLQVQSTSYSTQTSLGASSTYSATPLSVTITPQSTTSKVYVTASLPSLVATANELEITIFRGSTNLATGALASFCEFYSAGGAMFGTPCIQFLDSPSTTSPTTYTVQTKQPGSNATIFPNGSTGVLTVMEISGS